jgi:putative GTP pyrophosphokinase
VLESAADWRATGAHIEGRHSAQCDPATAPAGSIADRQVGRRRVYDRSVAAAPSRKQIRKAASLLRKWWISPEDPPVTDEVAEAWLLVRDFRAGFQRPLDKVTIQLRRIVGYESEEVVVAQRLKRMPTILDKLERQPTMDITRMQDIGGCRAVLLGSERDRVLERIGSHWPVQKVYDYVEAPKPTGYRAIHVVVLRDDRLIEIQLRSRAQQRWAVAVERTGVRLRQPVKDGVGPEPVLRYFWLLGEVIGLMEGGVPPDDARVMEVDAELESLSEQVRALVARTG